MYNTPIEYNKGWQINLGGGYLVFVDGKTLEIVPNKFDLGGTPVGMCCQPKGSKENNYGPFDMEEKRFWLGTFEVAFNPLHKREDGDNKEIREKLKKTGMEETWRNIERYEDSLLKKGADKIWRIWRLQPVTLVAHSKSELSYCIFCELALIGVKTDED